MEDWATSRKGLTWLLFLLPHEDNLIVKVDVNLTKMLEKIVLGNSVPAAAAKQRGQALFMVTGLKGCVGGHYC